MVDVPDGSIVITPKEFYDGVSKDIAEIKAAVSPLPEFKVQLDELEKRTSVLERRIWIATGFCSAVAFGAGIAIQFIH